MDSRLSDMYLGWNARTAVVLFISVISVLQAQENFPKLPVTSPGQKNDLHESFMSLVFFFHERHLKWILISSQVAYHTPPRFPAEVIDCIRQGVSLLFRHLGLHDFARIDGWFLTTPVTSLHSAENSGKFGHTRYGTILFTDINLVSMLIQLFILIFL
jgi:hypothetical protein